MSAIKDLVDLVDKLNKSKADREIMPLIIEINKVTEQVKLEIEQVNSENSTLKIENAELKKQLPPPDAKPAKPIISSGPRTFGDKAWEENS